MHTAHTGANLLLCNRYDVFAHGCLKIRVRTCGLEKHVHIGSRHLTLVHVRATRVGLNKREPEARRWNDADAQFGSLSHGSSLVRDSLPAAPCRAPAALGPARPASHLHPSFRTILLMFFSTRAAGFPVYVHVPETSTPTRTH
jgi:hypothetical protein